MSFQSPVLVSCGPRSFFQVAANPFSRPRGGEATLPPRRASRLAVNSRSIVVVHLPESRWTYREDVLNSCTTFETLGIQSISFGVALKRRRLLQNGRRRATVEKVVSQVSCFSCSSTPDLSCGVSLWCRIFDVYGPSDGKGRIRLCTGPPGPIHGLSAEDKKWNAAAVRFSIDCIDI